MEIPVLQSMYFKLSEIDSRNQVPAFSFAYHYPAKGCGNPVNVKYLVDLKYVGFLLQLDICKKKHILWPLVCPARYTTAADAEAETPVLWPPDAKSWLIWKDPDVGKDWGQEEKGTTKDKMVGWQYQLDGHGFGGTLEVGDGQGGLACCISQGHKESEMTERLNWPEHLIQEIGDNRQWYCWEPGKAQRVDPEKSSSRKPLQPLGWKEKRPRTRGGWQ